MLIDTEGRPWVTDFGMAALLDDERRLTVTKAILGKPDYMSPEQANPRSGSSARLTTASDIFSLGAVLYRALTGRLPFAAETPLATLERIRNDNPVSPRALSAAVDRDLETILLKCLSKNPGDRYASASALADDLDHWLHGEPILARPLGPVHTAIKWVKRKPLKAAAIGLALAALLGPLLAVSYLYFVVMPWNARTDPSVGMFDDLGAFILPLAAGRPNRATPNFDHYGFQHNSRPMSFYFTNVPPEHLAWFQNLKCQVVADIPGAPDSPRSKVARPGERFMVSAFSWQDRAYYLAPQGWDPKDALGRAPDARLVLVMLDHGTSALDKPGKPMPRWRNLGLKEGH